MKGTSWKTALVFAALLPVDFLLAAEGSPWRVLPIRSREEFEGGKIGGESEQHLHGIARCLAHPDAIYLSHDVGQVWKSSNSGETWRKTSGKGLLLFASLSIEVDPVNPNLVFLICDTWYNWLVPPSLRGVYRSRDGGESWEQVLPLVTTLNRFYQHAIDYDPASVDQDGAKVWYAATPESGLFRSQDGGTTWSPAGGLPGAPTVYDLECGTNDGTTVYAATSAGLLAGGSGGGNLIGIGNLPAGEVTSLEIDPSDPRILYAVLDGQGLYKTTTGPDGFSLIRSFDASRVFINPGHPETVYLVGKGTNTITSHDGGGSWITDMETLPFPGLGRAGSGWKAWIAGELSGIVPDPRDPDEAVAYSRASLWKTTDGGHRFLECSTLYTGYSWGWWNDGAAFDPDDPERFAFFNADVGMTITTTGGEWFERYNDQAWDWYQQGLIGWIGTHAGDIQPIPGSQVIVASVGNYFRTQLMRTEDGGINWTLVTQGSENFDTHLFIAFHPEDPNLVFAGNKVSRDAGRTFSPIDFQHPEPPSIVGMCKSHPDVLFAMNSHLNSVLRSTDRGETWPAYTTPGWGFHLLDRLPTFAADPVDPGLIYTLDADADLASFDGTTWRSFGLLDLAGGREIGNFVRAVTVDPRHPEVIYAVMFAAGLPGMFRSVNGGGSWEDITYNLPRLGAGAISVHPHTGELLRGSAAGTWIFPAPYESPNTLYKKAVSLSMTDCNGNGVDDAAEIAMGMSADCNGNGIPDGCDIASGTSTDSSGNGIPDECRGRQFPGDANGDGSLDLSDPIWLLFHLFVGDPMTKKLPCEGRVATAPGPSELLVLDFNGDGRLDVSDAVASISFLFLGDIPHILGTGCFLISDCPDTCLPAAGP